MNDDRCRGYIGVDPTICYGWPFAGWFRCIHAGRRKGVNRAIAQELLVAEAANVINKKRKSGELTGNESDKLLSDLLAVPIRLFPQRLLIERAFEMVREHSLPVYDTFQQPPHQYCNAIYKAQISDKNCQFRRCPRGASLECQKNVCRG